MGLQVWGIQPFMVLLAWSKGLQPGCKGLQVGLQVGSQLAAGSGVVSVR